MTDNDLEQLGMDESHEDRVAEEEAIAAEISRSNQERSPTVNLQPLAERAFSQLRDLQHQQGPENVDPVGFLIAFGELVLKEQAGCGCPQQHHMYCSKRIADPCAGVRAGHELFDEAKAEYEAWRIDTAKSVVAMAKEMGAERAATIGRIMEAYFDGQHECQVSDRVRLLEILRKELEK